MPTRPDRLAVLLQDKLAGHVDRLRDRTLRFAYVDT
jgi:hypothetical protein